MKPPSSTATAAESPASEGEGGPGPLGRKPKGKWCHLDAPCLFDIEADPTEHDDVSGAHANIVARMQRRVLELLEGEVTLKDSKIPLAWALTADAKAGADLSPNATNLSCR